MNNELRWKQRFQNFEKAYEMLNRALKRREEAPEDEMIQMALVQVFEFTYELSWKTMKDYLESQGIDAKTPRDAIKQAFRIELIEDGHVWMQALENRDLTVHTYNEKMSLEIEKLIKEEYYPKIKQLYDIFKDKL